MWTPAITVPQIRWCIAAVLHRALGCDETEFICRTSTRRLKRKEQARLYAWKKHKRLPPLRIRQQE